MSELILSLGQVPVAPYAMPGTNDLSETLVPFLPEAQAIIMARHGAITWGKDIEDALGAMERLEHSAQILKAAVELGGITELPQTEILKLLKLRKSLI
jgi:L-fuculose-phosphate aldolase